MSSSATTSTRRASSPLPYSHEARSVSPIRPIRTIKSQDSANKSVSMGKDMNLEKSRSARKDLAPIIHNSENICMRDQSGSLTVPITRPSIGTPWNEPCADSFAVVSRNIYNLWHDQQLCDVKIRAGGRQFLAHKLVMAASCGIFTEEREERSTPISSDLVIHDVNADAMNDVLKYFYTHRLHISGHNVDSLLKIAKDLNIQVIIEKCKEFLKDICMKNVVQNRWIAQKFGLSDILAHIDQYFRENFQELCCTSSFLQSDFQQVFDIVSSDVFSPGSALEVFNACASWIDFNRQERLKYAVPLMSLVRFGQIPAENLVSDVEIVQHIFDIPDCKEMLYQAFKYHALVRDYISPAVESRRQSVQSRGSRSAPSIPSDITDQYPVCQQENDTSRDAVFKVGSSSSEKQTSALSMQTTGKPTFPRAHSAHSIRASRDETSISRSSSIIEDRVLVEDTHVPPDIPSPPGTRTIFVVGGINSFDLETTNSILQMIQQYDPQKNCWTGRTNIPLPLRDCGVTSLDGYVYVIGGTEMDFSLDFMEVTARCHRYDVAKNEWNQIAGMLTPRTDFATVVLNKVLYAVGGVDNLGHTLSSMEFYNVEENKWHYTSSMNELRMGLSAAGHRGHVLAVGGMIARPNADKLLLDTVESYNPSTNEWTLKSEFPLHVCRSSLVDVNDVLYLVGGCVTRDGDSILSLSNIFRYRDDADTWDPFTELHVPRHHATAVALDSRLYVIGGTSSATIGRALSNVECIDVETEERIEGIAPLPTPAYGLGSCADSGDF